VGVAEPFRDGPAVHILRVERARDAQAGKGVVAPDRGGEQDRRFLPGGHAPGDPPVGRPVEVEHAPVDAVLAAAEVHGIALAGEVRMGRLRLQQPGIRLQRAQQRIHPAFAAACRVVDGVEGCDQDGGHVRQCALKLD